MECIGATTAGDSAVEVYYDSDWSVARVMCNEVQDVSSVRALLKDLATGNVVASRMFSDRRELKIDLRSLASSAAFELTLQKVQQGVWTDLEDAHDYLIHPQFRLECVCPSDWGVSTDCWVTIQDSTSSNVLLHRIVSSGQTVWFARSRSAVAKLSLRFRSVVKGSRKPGLTIGNTHRWSPVEDRGSLPSDVRTMADGLQASSRTEVVLAPAVLAKHGVGVHAAIGYVGAWERSSPIPEALLAVLGRQYMNYLPMVEPQTWEHREVIYLGLPHGGWGHFLTQGLSRIWYALERPDLPVVWDTRKLRPYQEKLLRTIGLQNEQLFLKRPTGFDKVIFPFPGISIGDEVHPAFLNRIGVEVETRPIPGKKILLSRARLSGQESQMSIDSALERLASNYGFDIVHPEELSIEEQLGVIASSEIVLGVEGSAMHTPILIAGDLDTSFFAIARHRAGGGVFEHIRRAKGLRYETLNVGLNAALLSARDDLDLDLDLLATLFDVTGGLEANRAALRPYLSQPSVHETAYASLMAQFKCRTNGPEEALMKTHLALLDGDEARAKRILVGSL